MQKHPHFDEEQLRKLLRLKRYENPGEEYFSDFLAEHRRRRAEWVQARAQRGFFGKLQERLDLLIPSTPNGWTAVSAAATAVVVFSFLVIELPQPKQPAPRTFAEQTPAAPETEVLPADTPTNPLEDALNRPVIVPQETEAPVEFSEEDALPVIYSDLISPVQYSSQPSRDRMLRRQVLVPVIIRSPLSHEEALDLLSPDYRHPDPEDADFIHTALDDTRIPQQ